MQIINTIKLVLRQEKKSSSELIWETCAVFRVKGEN